MLEIWATDNDNSDEIVNDEWHIGTLTAPKTACLTRTGKGKPEDLIGGFLQVLFFVLWRGPFSGFQLRYLE